MELTCQDDESGAHSVLDLHNVGVLEEAGLEVGPPHDVNHYVALQGVSPEDGNGDEHLNNLGEPGGLK